MNKSSYFASGSLCITWWEGTRKCFVFVFFFFSFSFLKESGVRAIWRSRETTLGIVGVTSWEYEVMGVVTYRWAVSDKSPVQLFLCLLGEIASALN